MKERKIKRIKLCSLILVFLIAASIAGCAQSTEELVTSDAESAETVQPTESMTTDSSVDNTPQQPEVKAESDENFTLTQEQAAELFNDVAAPLLLTEWNAVMDYSNDIYNPADWQNQQHFDVSDLDNRLVNGIPYEYWRQLVLLYMI